MSEGSTLAAQDRKKQDKTYLSIPADTYYLDGARQFIVDRAEKAGLPKEEIELLEMAVDEAITNIIKHSYTQTPNFLYKRKTDIVESIDITVEIGRDEEKRKNKMSITLADKGTGLDIVNDVRPLDLEEHLKKMKSRGLGIHVIKTFMDEIYFKRIKDVGNELTMVKYF